MAIDIHIDTTVRQDAKLAMYLTRTNASNVANGLPPYATVNDLFKALLIETAKDLIKFPDLEDAEKVKGAYIDASDATQSQVKTLLNIT